ncbi:MAG: hypothetical protein R3C16_03475 [Hyphomonadaceae bacterium]
MKKTLQIGVGAFFVLLGCVMLIAILRSGDTSGAMPGQALLAPLGLIGAGALAITSARRPPKKW